MKPRDVQRGDVIEKPPFWPRPMRVTDIWHDGDSLYADVVPAEGEPYSPMAGLIPMQIAQGTQNRLLHPEVIRVLRDGKVVFERKPPNDDAATRRGGSAEGATPKNQTRKATVRKVRE